MSLLVCLFLAILHVVVIVTAKILHLALKLLIFVVTN